MELDSGSDDEGDTSRTTGFRTVHSNGALDVSNVSLLLTHATLGRHGSRRRRTGGAAFGPFPGMHNHREAQFTVSVGGFDHIHVVRSLTHHNTVGSCLPGILGFAPSLNAVVAQINALPSGEWKFVGVAIMMRVLLVCMVVQLC